MADNPMAGNEKQKLPVVQKGEPLEDWLAKVVPLLVSQEGLDEAEAKDLATQAWNAVNGDGAQDGGMNPGGDTQKPADGKQPSQAKDKPPQATDAQNQLSPKEKPFGNDKPDTSEHPKDKKNPFASAQDKPKPTEQGNPVQAQAKDDPVSDNNPQMDAQGNPPPKEKQGDGKLKGPATWENEASWGSEVDGAGNQPDEGEEPTQEASADAPTAVNPKLMGWLRQNLTDYVQQLVSALVQNGNVEPAVGDELSAVLVSLIDGFDQAGMEPERDSGMPTKAASMISFLEAAIHANFTTMADSMRQEGRLTRDERIALSGSVGDMLSTFIDSVQSKLGAQFMARSPFLDIEQMTVTSTPVAGSNELPGGQVGTPEPSLLAGQSAQGGGQVGTGGVFRFEVTLPAFTTDPMSKAILSGFTAVEVGAEFPYMVIAFPEHGRVLAAGEITEKSVAAYVTDQAALWDLPGATLGGWCDPVANQVRLDVVLPAKTSAEAELLAVQHGQKFYVHLPTGAYKAVHLTWAQDDIDKLAAGKIKGEFAGNNRTYPIASRADVAKSWLLVESDRGAGDDTRKKIIRIAADYGWTDGLPAKAVDWAAQNKVPLKANSLDLETLRSVWVATKGFIGPSFRAKHRLDDSPTDLTCVKSSSRDRTMGYLCLWGDRNRRDLSGEWFSPRTQELTTIFDAMGGVPAIYHHAFDDVLKSMVVGAIDTMKMDDVGLWVEAQIKRADEYQRFIAPLIEQRKLGWSSGTLPGARRVDAKTGEILRWPIIEGSKTYSPAEWRMRAEWPIGTLEKAYALAGFHSSKSLTQLLAKPNQNDLQLKLEQERLALFELSIQE